MIISYAALFVALAFVLPGALYTWGFERTLSSWGDAATDRIIRFLGSSAVFHVLVAPLSWCFYRYEIFSGRLAHGQASLWLWPSAMLYLLLPTAAGCAVGVATRQGARWSRLITGDAPAPRAWDHVFSSGRSIWLRIRLSDATGDDGGWIFGLYAQKSTEPGPFTYDSFASGSGQDRDLFLTDIAWLDGTSGQPLRNPDGMPRLRGVGILINWDQIVYTEVIWG
ncbi:DUF6338 family protein [Streptomyces sp. RKAG293]|uniref:DUF6338 family protein n=1 Tax=Streptomyces sp. RKAG293 TaxID=2893403 RepID=UPI0020347DBF|nr:DUF6338 family protein [Streptomyces sp. RKAG293]MCM2422610.1 DUF6338 family protein [Streptomyces sp. RKAG293]